MVSTRNSGSANGPTNIIKADRDNEEGHTRIGMMLITFPMLFLMELEI